MWMALLGPLPEAGVVRQRGEDRLHRRRAADRAACWPTRCCGPAACSIPATPPAQAEWGITAANDQSAAGAIMMIEGSIVTIGLFCWLFLRAARESDEKQALVELAARARRRAERGARRPGGRGRPRRRAARADSAQFQVQRGAARPVGRAVLDVLGQLARRREVARAQVRAQHVDRRGAAEHDRRPRLRQRRGQRDVVDARRAARWPAPP